MLLAKGRIGSLRRDERNGGVRARDGVMSVIAWLQKLWRKQFRAAQRKAARKSGSWPEFESRGGGCGSHIRTLGALSAIAGYPNNPCFSVLLLRSPLEGLPCCAAMVARSGLLKPNSWRCLSLRSKSL